MIKYKNIREVRLTNENPLTYECVIDLDVGDGYRISEYAAIEDGGGICNDLIRLIQEGKCSFANNEYKEENFIFSKAKLFQSLSDNEYEQFENIISKLSAREKAIYNNLLTLENFSDLMTKIKKYMSETYGIDRTKEILNFSVV